MPIHHQKKDITPTPTSSTQQQMASPLPDQQTFRQYQIERRFARFVANERIVVSEVWKQFLSQVLPYWHGKSVLLVLGCTPCADTATIVYVVLLAHSRYNIVLLSTAGFYLLCDIVSLTDDHQ